MAIPDSKVREELGDLFHEAVTDHPDVMAECLSILRIYNLPPSTLFYKYEAFLLSRPSGLRQKLSVLSLDTVRELRKEIQREQQAKTVGAGNETPKAGLGMKKGKGNMSDLGGFLDGLNTPSRPRPNAARLSNTANNVNLPSPSSGSAFSPSNFSTPQRATPAGASSSSYRPSSLAVPLKTPGQGSPVGKNGHSPSSPGSGADSGNELTPATQPFHLRPQPHSLVETLNPHLPSSSSSGNTLTKPRVLLSSPADPKDWNYRYMFEKISQRSEALDDLIDEFAETIKDAYSLTELGDPHFQSEESIFTVGRILSPQTDNGKATSTSLFLESSRLLGAGKRIALRFADGLKVVGGSGVKGFGVFPGCLVGIKGRNGGGGVFVVEQVLMPPPSALSQSPTSELISFQHEKLAGLPMAMMTAAGPYTLDDDLLYHPLEALTEVVIKEKPDVLVLLGPFIDSQHPLISLGAISQTPMEIFRDQIGTRLQRIVENSPGTVVIMVPSVRDMISRHVAFPQAMLEKELLGLPKRIKFLPNPCTFNINEVVVSLTSIDTLFHLRREEFFQKAEPFDQSSSPSSPGGEVRDPMAGLVRHVLGQRSFYPIFPPPESLAGDVNLDVTHASLLKMVGPAPDVLITPSKLRHFSKVVDSTLVVNPAHLSRAHSAGTFAKIIIHPTSRNELEQGMDVDGLEEMREHGIWERARSEIWRI